MRTGFGEAEFQHLHGESGSLKARPRCGVRGTVFAPSRSSAHSPTRRSSASRPFRDRTVPDSRENCRSGRPPCYAPAHGNPTCSFAVGEARWILPTQQEPEGPEVTAERHGCSRPSLISTFHTT